MPPDYPALAFIDIETTGSNVNEDDIIEAAIIRIDAGGCSQWQQLFRPRQKIPVFISKLTGISNRLVTKKPGIAALLPTISSLLQDAIFAAHNARFDFNFLNRQYTAAGLPELDNQILCTYKLAKYLYPAERQNGVKALIKRFNLDVGKHHRAYSDAAAIYQFWLLINRELPAATVKKAVRQVLKEENNRLIKPPRKKVPI